MITILLMKWVFVDPDTHERVHWDREGCLYRVVLNDLGDAAVERQVKDAAGDLGWGPFGDDVSNARIKFEVLSAALKRLTAGAWSTNTESAGEHPERRMIDLGLFENGQPARISEVA